MHDTRMYSLFVRSNSDMERTAPDLHTRVCEYFLG